MSSAYTQLSTLPHLKRAWQSIAKRNRLSRGIDGVTIDEFQKNLDRNLENIAEELKARNYGFSSARGVLIPKPGTSKKRAIKIPAVRDRVVLKAIALLVESKFTKYNLPCSYGYIRGRGVRNAVARVRELADAGFTVVLEADIHKFFDEVDRDLLVERFVKEIRLHSLTALIQRALRVELGNLQEFDLEERELFPAAESGIPQGGVLSPMLANFYLYPFDKAMMERHYNLVRYADDFVVMCRHRQEALDAHRLCKEMLEERLKLQLHPLEEPNSKTRIVDFTKGLKFLGIQFAAGRIEPSQAIVNKFKERTEAILDARQGNSLLDVLTKLRNTIQGWGQCYREYDVTQIYADLDISIRNELSAYLRSVGLMSAGRILSKRQLKMLGVPSLKKHFPSRKTLTTSTLTRAAGIGRS